MATELEAVFDKTQGKDFKRSSISDGSAASVNEYYMYSKSQRTRQGVPTADSIQIFSQFMVSTDENRSAEYRYALNANANNPYIHSIILLNERTYSATELGSNSPKIRQIILGRRMQFSDYIDAFVPGYNVLLNADIFVDDSIRHVRESDIHEVQKMYALSRWELDIYEVPKMYALSPWELESKIKNHAGLGSQVNRYYIFFCIILTSSITGCMDYTFHDGCIFEADSARYFQIRTWTERIRQQGCI